MDFTKTNWFTKLIACLLVSIAITNTLTLILEFLPKSVLEKLPDSFDIYFFSIQFASCFLFGIGYSIYWQKIEKKNSVNSCKKYFWILAIIRYWLAFEICSYGFAKILGTQFHTPNYRKDMLLGEVNGFGLTWYYYGYSYTLAVIIATFQIVGSILLLFRRTLLLGTFILLPVMLNIVFINLFYNIATGAFVNSIIFSIGLLFILVLHWSILKNIFFQFHFQLPQLKFGFVTFILKLSPVLFSWLLIFYYVKNDISDTKLLGTWKVIKMVKNNDTLTANSWLTDSLSYSKIYFDGIYGCAFSPNPYRYKAKEARHGSYTYDTVTHLLKATLFGNASKADTMFATITTYTKDSLLLKGVYRKDSIVLTLRKEIKR
jgi:hypothetical protein